MDSTTFAKNAVVLRSIQQIAREVRICLLSYPMRLYTRSGLDWFEPSARNYCPRNCCKRTIDEMTSPNSSDQIKAPCVI
eukprot:scaffold6931_cov443-Prasinococcus_capsulatus_cf.AAC.3